MEDVEGLVGWMRSECEDRRTRRRRKGNENGAPWEHGDDRW